MTTGERIFIGRKREGTRPSGVLRMEAHGQDAEGMGKRSVIAMEDNRPSAIESLRRAADGCGAPARVLKTKGARVAERRVKAL